MKILAELPPNYEQIVAAIPGVADRMTEAIFTYYPNIYYPTGGKLPDYKIAHEMVHLNQQSRYGVDDWWYDYLLHDGFRLQQEIEAYRVDYKAFCKKYKDRNERARYLMDIVGDLSGAGYGNIISAADARKQILL